MTTPTPEPVALLPCPLCGSPALIDWGPTGRYVGVECGTCGAFGGEQKGIAHDADRKAMELLAITAWNTRAATVPQGVSDQDALDARRFRDLVGWYDGLKMSRAETVCDLLGLPEADAINAGFNDLVDAYAENRDAATTPPPAELGEGELS